MVSDLNALNAAAATDELAGALEEPAFLDDEGPSADIPPFITTTNIRELYDWKPGESLDEAMARKKAQEG